MSPTTRKRKTRQEPRRPRVRPQARKRPPGKSRRAKSRRRPRTKVAKKVTQKAVTRKTAKKAAPQRTARTANKGTLRKSSSSTAARKKPRRKTGAPRASRSRQTSRAAEGTGETCDGSAAERRRCAEAASPRPHRSRAGISARFSKPSRQRVKQGPSYPAPNAFTGRPHDGTGAPAAQRAAVFGDVRNGARRPRRPTAIGRSRTAAAIRACAARSDRAARRSRRASRFFLIGFAVFACPPTLAMMQALLPRMERLRVQRVKPLRSASALQADRAGGRAELR